MAETAKTDVDCKEEDKALCSRGKKRISTTDLVPDDDDDDDDDVVDDAGDDAGDDSDDDCDDDNTDYDTFWARIFRMSARVEARIESWLKECEKLPPMYSDEPGEVDISGAALVEVDVPVLKKMNKDEYQDAVDFASRCRKKSHLQLFRHPGDPRIGGLGSFRGRALTDEDRDLAVTAIKEYQKVKQEVKLKLRDLMKLNHEFGGGDTYYMTFSAEDEVTGIIKTYQAALREHCDGYLLGLFRDVVDDKVLAILSIKEDS